MAGYQHSGGAADPAGTGRPPGLTSTVVVTVLFGLFGLIPAYRDSQRAQRLGAPTGRYWVAFAWGFLGFLVLWGLIFVGLILGVILAVF